MRSENQKNARLGIIIVPLIGSIIFALAAFIPIEDPWKVISLLFSGMLGTVGLLAGVVTLFFQISRNKLSIRNVLVFGVVYFLAIFIFMGSCVTAIIEDIDEEEWSFTEPNSESA